MLVASLLEAMLRLQLLGKPIARELAREGFLRMAPTRGAIEGRMKAS